MHLIKAIERECQFLAEIINRRVLKREQFYFHCSPPTFVDSEVVKIVPVELDAPFVLKMQ